MKANAMLPLAELHFAANAQREELGMVTQFCGEMSQQLYAKFLKTMGRQHPKKSGVDYGHKKILTPTKT